MVEQDFPVAGDGEGLPVRGEGKRRQNGRGGIDRRMLGIDRVFGDGRIVPGALHNPLSEQSDLRR